MAKERTYGEQLRDESIGVRLSHSTIGVSRKLDRAHRDRAAAALNAEGEALKAAKRLFDTKNAKYKACMSVKSRARQYWVSVTLPYPDRGVRLMRRGELDSFEARMELFRSELLDAASQLAAEFDMLREEAQSQLGDMFDPADYPTDIAGEFALEWDFPSLQPPEYLKELAPDVWERESERLRQSFDSAVQLAEEAFTEELRTLVARLTERLTGDEDGKPKVFRDSAVENLSDFFERFKSLSVRSNADLDRVVDEAQQVIAGVRPAELRQHGDTRSRVREALSGVKDTLDTMMVDRPARSIRFDD